jgi:hypothetical protein
LQLSGVYDAATLDAVKKFQVKYASDVLTPWGISEPTGYVYLTTRKKINELFCGGVPFPLTSEEQSIIARARAAGAGLSASVSAGTGSAVETGVVVDTGSSSSTIATSSTSTSTTGAMKDVRSLWWLFILLILILAGGWWAWTRYFSVE